MSTLFLFFLLLHQSLASPGACTTMLVGKDASIDGSVMVTHSMDEGNNDFRLAYVPARDYPANEKRPVYQDYEVYPRVVSAAISPDYAPVDGQKNSVPIGYIPQVSHTYGYLDLSYGALNEHQLGIGESTCSAKTIGTSVGKGGNCLFWVGELSHVAMERCKTARCAVQLMGDLAEKYGFYGDQSFEGSGETLMVADPHEAWVFHVLSGLNGNGSGIWVAKRVPDNSMTVVANMYTVREVHLDNPDYYLGSKDMFSIAQSQGWWDGTSSFDFTAAFSEGEYAHRYYSGRRMWRAMDIVAPSLKLDPTIGSPLTTINGSYPWAVVPDKKISVKDLMRIHRDHYEGTEFDLTKGMASGPFGTPNRYDGGEGEKEVKGAWERAISVHRVNYNHISVLRNWLPNEIGPVMWFGPHVPHSTVFVPIYPAMHYVPRPYATGSQQYYSRDVAWWAHSFVGNWADLKFSYIIKDIQTAAAIFEQDEFDNQTIWEKEALKLMPDVEKVSNFLRTRCDENAKKVHNGWLKLADYLITKYNNGYINEPDDFPNIAVGVGYPAWWLKNKDVGYEQFPKLNV